MFALQQINRLSVHLIGLRQHGLMSRRDLRRLILVNLVGLLVLQQHRIVSRLESGGSLTLQFLHLAALISIEFDIEFTDHLIVGLLLG